MQKFEYVVVGGGIVGLSTAWTILEKKPGTRIAVVEKEEHWAVHQTGRNSGVLHSGIYYKPGSLKSKLCREGNRRLLEFCNANGIRHETCGKVIVATTESELPLMGNLYQRGLANGLAVKKLSAGAVTEIEPHVSCLAGIQVPSTGIVDFVGVCQKLVELIGGRGGELHLGTEVRGLRCDNAGAVLETSKGAMATGWIINCAGLHSDRVAKLGGARPGAQIVPFRGEYYELKPERRFLVKNLIYPVPDPQFPFLGVHFTRMIDGSVHAGPNAVLSFRREGYQKSSFDVRDFFETMTFRGFWKLARKHFREGMREIYRSFSKAAFGRSLQQLIPEIEPADLIPCKAGVRAQALLNDGRLVDDFLMIRGHNALHVCNTPSPAATASLEIAKTIVAQIPEQSARA